SSQRKHVGDHSISVSLTSRSRLLHEVSRADATIAKVDVCGSLCESLGRVVNVTTMSKRTAIVSKGGLLLLRRGVPAVPLGLLLVSRAARLVYEVRGVLELLDDLTAEAPPGAVRLPDHQWQSPTTADPYRHGARDAREVVGGRVRIG